MTGKKPRRASNTGLQKRLRYRDLVERGILNNRTTLANWTRLHGFPRGQLTGPNMRTWGEDDIQRWLDSRPTKPKPTWSTDATRPRGRPRKHAQRAELTT